MRNLFIATLLLLFSATAFAQSPPTYADPVASALSVIQDLTVDTKTTAEIKQIAQRFNESFGTQWSEGANPYDAGTDPVDHAAWPGNATNDEIATFFLGKMWTYGRSRLYQRGHMQGEDDAAGTIDATAQAYADEF